MPVPLDAQYESPLLEEITDLKLNGNLRSIREAVAGLWADGSLVHDFTDHGPEHNSRLTKYASKVLTCNQGQPLSQEELYVLMASIYLHDIGMQADVHRYPDLIDRAEAMGAQFGIKFTAPTTSRHTIEEQEAIRENHHWLSAAWIDHAFESKDSTDFNQAVCSIPPHARSAIVSIISYHSKRDINDLDEYFWWDSKHRRRLLAALLRLADEMDITGSRVNINVVKEHCLLPENALWWWLHYYTALDLDDAGMLTVRVTINKQDYAAYAPKVQDLIVARFEEKKGALIDLLFGAGIKIGGSRSGSGVQSDDYIEPLPSEIKGEIDKRMTPPKHPWYWLPENEPETYQQLFEKMEEHRQSLAPSGQSELRRLIEVFRWCKEHGIKVDELQTSKHLHKYQHAESKMRRLIDLDEPDPLKVKKMREIIERVRADHSSKDTRRWARSFRGQKANGCEFTLEGDSAALWLRGSSATVQRVRTEVEQFVDWTLSIGAALAEIQRVEHGGAAPATLEEA